MINIDILVQRINQLTQTINQLLNNSKSIDLLPQATSGNKSVAVYNSSNNLTEKFNLSQALAGIGGLTNAILQTSTINRDGNEFEFGAGFIWQINNVEYTNASSIFIEIPEATDGFFRIDIAVLNTNNDIVLIQGVESETSAIQPVTPQNTILLTVFNVFGSVINNPTPPIIGNEVVLKQYAQRFFANIPNDDPFFIQLQPTNQSYIVLSTIADNTIVTGINLSNVSGADQPYIGQLFIIENSSNKPIELEANGDGDVVFVLPNNQNIVFEPKNIAVFRYEGNDMQFLGFLNSNLQQVLTQGLTTNIQPTFENGIKTSVIESLGNGEGVFTVGDTEMQMTFANRSFETPSDETGNRLFATREWVVDNVQGETDLSYTPSPTNGVVTSSTGTDATIPLADATNAGLFAPAEKTKLANVADNANNYVHPNHTGDVTSVGDGVQTIANQAVTNAKFRNSTAHTVVGRAGSGNGSVEDITLNNNTILGREGNGNVEGLSTSQVQSMLGFDGKQNTPIVRNTNFTASLNSVNNVVADATATDPTPQEGLGYWVNVVNGVATIGEVAYGVGTRVFRHFHSGSWRNFVYNNETALAVTVTANITTLGGWNDRTLILNNDSGTRTITIDRPMNVKGLKTNNGTISFISGAGRTAVYVNVATQLDGLAGSSFAIVSSGTTDFIYLDNV